MPAELQAMQQARELYGSGRWDQAERLCRTILGSHADHFEALSLLGVIAAQTGRKPEAASLLQRAVAVKPDDARAASNYGNVLMELGRFDEALASYQRLLKLEPDSADGHNSHGVALQKLQRPAEALASYERALRLKPDYAQAHHNRGVALRALNRLQEALASYERALALRPEHADGYNNRGVVLQELGRPEQALASYEQALAIKPDDAEVCSNRGSALLALGRPEDALASYERALAIKPRNAEAHGHRANVLRELRRFDEALASYDRALAIRRDYVEVHHNRGVVLQELGRPQEALQSLERALELRPNDAGGYVSHANALMRLRRPEQALASYARARALEPEHPWLHGSWLHAKTQLCDWRDLGVQVARLLEAVEQARKAVLPFYALALTDSLALQRQAATTWASCSYPAVASMPAIGQRAPHKRIRLGYYSADFHNHATAYLTAGLFEQHDRSRFELTAVSFGAPRHDDMRQRLTAAFDHFVDVRTRSDREVAQLSRDLQIDIAVDLKGFTEQARTGIFAHRAAPLQVSYLGYPGTMAAPYIDYLIADPTLIPPASRPHYTERIVYLPHSYQANDRKRPVAEQHFTRAELGLPPRGFVFCCFNNTYKVTPDTFDVWMRIVKRTAGSVLWLLADSETATVNLRREAEARGVSGARLVFAPRMPLAQHLARQRAADLFLDTFPYNAHTTASDALWAGLPVLTRCGESFVARVAASLLRAVGLPELITTTAAEYESVAAGLAADPDRLAQLSGSLHHRRLAVPLFDTTLFTRQLEQAYTQMHERYLGGLNPEHLYVDG
jgi:protein O-GlcNAc transferase